MKRALLIIAICLASFAVAADPFEEALEAHTAAAESKLLKTFDGFRQAREALAAAINSVSDPERQKRLRDAVIANDVAWDKLIESELVLRHAGRAAQPDIRQRRLVEAEYSAERTRKLNEWAASITRDARK